MHQQAPIIPYHSPLDAGVASPTFVGWRHLLWFGLLLGASAAFSLGLACATPFAAFGAAAVLTLSRREALVLILSVWLANQIIGFAVLDYPWTAGTFGWGIALAVAVVVATLAGEWTARHLVVASRAVKDGVILLLSFVLYEAVLYAVAAVLLGGTGDFAAAVLGQIFAINAAVFIGLLLLNHFGISAGRIINPSIPLSAEA
jgi:hypothetical protein